MSEAHILADVWWTPTSEGVARWSAARLLRQLRKCPDFCHAACTNMQVFHNLCQTLNPDAGGFPYLSDACDGCLQLPAEIILALTTRTRCLGLL